MGQCQFIRADRERLTEVRDAFLIGVLNHPEDPRLLVTLAELQNALGEGARAAESLATAQKIASDDKSPLSPQDRRDTLEMVAAARKKSVIDGKPRDKVWIVIAAYREQGRLAATLSSVLAEGYPNIVVVDDGSPDDTAAAALALPIWLLKHPINLGQGAALQTGIDFALERGQRSSSPSTPMASTMRPKLSRSSNRSATIPPISPSVRGFLNSKGTYRSRASWC